MRTKKALYNIISQMSYEVVATVCALILPRLILSAYGSSYNGVVASITQFLDYISFLTLGISGATRVAIYKAKATDDIRNISAVLKSTENYMRKVAYAFIVYLLFLIVVYPMIVQKEFAWFDVASLVIIIGLGTFAEYFFGITYRTFLMADQSNYIYNVIQIFSKIGNTLISVLLINMGQSIQVVKLGSAICFVAAPIILNYIVRKKYKIITDIEPDETALQQRNDVMAHSIANCIHQYIGIFLLTFFSSTSIISVYSIYGLVLGSLQKLQVVFTTGLEGAFGELWARGEKAKFEKNFSIFEFFIFSFASIVFACTLVLILPFVKLYTKGIHDVNYILPIYASIAILAQIFFCIRAPYLIATQAAGKYKETKKGAFIEAFLNLMVSFIGVLKFQIIGVALGLCVANAFRTVQYAVFLSKNILNRSMLVFFKRVFWLCFNVVSIVTVFDVFLFWNIDDWNVWIFSAIILVLSSTVFTTISAYFFFNQEFMGLFDVLKRMLSRKRK